MSERIMMIPCVVYHLDRAILIHRLRRHFRHMVFLEHAADCQCERCIPY